MEGFSRAIRGKRLDVHMFCLLEGLFGAATGQAPPKAVFSNPGSYDAMFPPNGKLKSRNCWSALEDITPLADFVQDYAKRHPFIKGIHLDKIRFPNAAFQESNPCICSGCRERRRSWLGRGTLTAEDLHDPSVMYKEIETKVRIITRIVRELSSVLRALDLRISIAARAVYAGRDTEFNRHPTWGYGPAIFEGQDWAAWCREGLLDDIHFMNYSTDVERFSRIARQHKALLAGSGVVHYEGIGVQSSAGKMSPEVLRREIETAKDLGVDGVTVFGWAAMTEEYLRVMETA